MSASNTQKSNWIVLAIILATTFIPSGGSLGLIKLGIIVLLCCLRAKKRLNDRYAVNGRKKCQRIILLWFASIFLAAITVILTEGKVNFSTIEHELSRVLYYLCVIILCFNMTISLKHLFYACSIIILIHCLIQVTQYFSLGTFDQYIRQYYLNGDENNQHYLMSKQLYGEAFRSGSIFINPNVYVCYPYLSLGVYLQYYRRTKGYLPLIMVGVAFISIVLTGSRMGLATFALIIIWFIWYSSKHRSGVQSYKGYLVIAGIIVLIIFNFNTVIDFAEGMRAFNLDSAYEGSGSVKFAGLLGYIKISNPLEWVFGSLGADRLAIPIDMELGYIFSWFGIFGLYWYVKLIRLVYVYHKTDYRIISSISAFSIILTAIGASSVLNMSVFPYICVIAFTNIIQYRQ